MFPICIPDLEILFLFTDVLIYGRYFPSYHFRIVIHDVYLSGLIVLTFTFRIMFPDVYFVLNASDS